MRIKIFLFIAMTSFRPSWCQLGPSDKIEFDVIDPFLYVIPFAQLEPESIDLSQYNFNTVYGDFFDKSIVTDDFIITVSGMRQNTNYETVGAVIEKVDLRTQEVLWQNVILPQETGVKEFLTNMYMVEDNRLEVLTKVENTKYDNIAKFGRSTDPCCQLSVRRYDLETGEKLLHSIPDSNDLNSRILSTNLENHALTYPISDDHFSYTIYENYDSFYRKYQRYEFHRYYIDSDGREIRDSTTYTVPMPEYVDSTWWGENVFYRMAHKSKDTLVAISHVSKETDDSFLSYAQISLLDEDLNLINSFDISPHLPLALKTSLFKVDNDFIYIKSGVIADSTFQSATDLYSIFDYNGELITEFKFGDESILAPRVFFDYEEEIDEFLILGQKGPNEINFFRTNNKTELIEYPTITFARPTWLLGEVIHSIDGKRVLCNFTQRNTSDSPTLPAWIGFDLDLLEKVDVDDKALNSEQIIVWPNPVSSILSINIPLDDIDNIKMLRILDMHGRVSIEVYDFSGSLDVSNLPSSIYTIQLVDSEDNVINSKFIKI